MRFLGVIEYQGVIEKVFIKKNFFEQKKLLFTVQKPVFVMQKEAFGRAKAKLLSGDLLVFASGKLCFCLVDSYFSPPFSPD